MKYAFILLLAFSLFSCETNWGKYDGYALDYDSALDYYIILDKGEVISAADTDTERKKKAVLVTFHNDPDKVDSLLLGRGAIIIESFVNNVIHNSDFVLVDQKPLDSVCECNEQCIQEKYKGRSDLNTYNHCKGALENSTFHQYWIIKKNVNQIYGPLSKEKFLQKRKELGVPEELKFMSKWKRMIKSFF